MAQEDRPHDYDSAGGQSQAWMVSSGLDECVANCQNKNEMIAALYASTQGLLNTMTQSMVRGYPPPKKVNFEPTVGSLVCVTGNNGNYQKGLVNYVDKSSQKWKYSVFLVNENGNSNLVSKTVEANDIFPFRYIDVSFNRVITVYKHDSRAQNIIFVGAEKGIHQTKGYYVWRMVLDKGSEVTGITNETFYQIQIKRI